MYLLRYRSGTLKNQTTPPKVDVTGSFVTMVSVAHGPGSRPSLATRQKSIPYNLVLVLDYNHRPDRRCTSSESSAGSFTSSALQLLIIRSLHTLMYAFTLSHRHTGIDDSLTYDAERLSGEAQTPLPSSVATAASGRPNANDVLQTEHNDHHKLLQVNKASA